MAVRRWRRRVSLVLLVEVLLLDVMSMKGVWLDGRDSNEMRRSNTGRVSGGSEVAVAYRNDALACIRVGSPAQRISRRSRIHFLEGKRHGMGIYD